MRLGPHSHLDLAAIPLGQLIGEGTSAKVYAVSLDLGDGAGLQRLALKLCCSSIPEAEEQLLVQAVAMTRCYSSRFVIKLHAYQGPDQPGGMHYFLMQRADSTLAHVLALAAAQRSSPDQPLLQPHQTQVLLSTLLLGLNALQAHSVVHGDISAQNILMVGGSAKISGFGGATVGSHANAYASSTPTHTAPEALAPGAKPAASWSLWAIGTLMWELQAGPVDAAGSALLHTGHVDLSSGFSLSYAALMQGLLQPVAAQRLTLEGALLHSYFDTLATPQQSPRGPAQQAAQQPIQQPVQQSIPQPIQQSTQQQQPHVTLTPQQSAASLDLTSLSQVMLMLMPLPTDKALSHLPAAFTSASLSRQQQQLRQQAAAFKEAAVLSVNLRSKVLGMKSASPKQRPQPSELWQVQAAEASSLVLGTGPRSKRMLVTRVAVAAGLGVAGLVKRTVAVVCNSL